MRLIDAGALYTFICKNIDEMTNVGVAVDGDYLWQLINHAINSAPTIEPCEDAISRRDAIKEIRGWFQIIELNPDILIDNIKCLPSVAPSRPSGEWIEAVYEGQPYNVYGVMYKCSECGYAPMYMGEPIIPTTDTLLFCPNCGAKMKGAEDDNNL